MGFDGFWGFSMIFSTNPDEFSGLRLTAKAGDFTGRARAPDLGWKFMDH